MPLVIYSVLRVALLGAALLGLWAAGLRGWLLILVAAVVATAASYTLLSGPRDAAALWLADRAARRRADGTGLTAAIEQDNADEDSEADRRAPGSEQGPGQPGQSARPRPSSTP